jgi:hypothetical protein
MKSLNLKLFISSFVFVIAIIASTNSVFAQSDKILVDIPFDFNVGNQEFLAGKYEVSRLKESTFLIRNTDKSKTILIPRLISLVANAQVTGEKLVFNHYNNKYFLRQIFANRTPNGYLLIESKSEKSIIKGLANKLAISTKDLKPEQVSISTKIN